MKDINFHADSVRRFSRAFLPILTLPAKLEKLNLAAALSLYKTFVRRECLLVFEGATILHGQATLPARTASMFVLVNLGSGVSREV